VNDLARPWESLPELDSCVPALGLFDGVHVGHREILRRTLRAARRVSAPACVFSFANHPRTVLGPKDAEVPRLIVTPERRAEILRDLGIEHILMTPFTTEWAETDAESFARDFVAGRLGAKHVVVGFNYCFGHRAAGRTRQLVQFGDRYGFSTEIVPPYRIEGEQVSSTRIRDAIRAGRLDLAEKLLGRPHEIRGVVIHGDGRGRSLGYPTANVQPDLPLLLPSGVYAVRVRIREDSKESPAFNGMFFAGRKRTFVKDSARVSLEVHLIGFEGDLYGRRVRLELLAKIREEMEFGGPEELVAQLDRDRVRCETYF